MWTRFSQDPSNTSWAGRMETTTFHTLTLLPDFMNMDKESGVERRETLFILHRVQGGRFSTNQAQQGVKKQEDLYTKLYLNSPLCNA